MKRPDFEIPARYLARNFAPDDRIAVVQIQPGVETVQALRTVEQVCSERYMSHLRGSNANGKDIYVSMNSLKPDAPGRTKADIAAVRHVYLDLDSGGRPALDRILEAQELPKPHEVLESSPDKYQIIWRVQEFEQRQAEELMRMMARQYGADPAATDISRVLRLPGFRNWKYEQHHYVREVGSREMPCRVLTPADFQRIERATEYQLRSTAGRAYDGAAGTGTQSHKDFAYACRQLERGTPAGDIRSAIAEYRSRDGKHANPEAYAARTVAAAQRHTLLRGGGGSVSSVSAEVREESGLER